MYRDKDKIKAYNAAYYRRNREEIKARSRKRQLRLNEEWEAFKAGLSCICCGAKHPAIIDFHHPDGLPDKRVSELTRRGKYKEAYEEAARCQALCSNCHRIHHYNERKKGDT